MAFAGSKVANGIALVPLVTPELVVGSALYLVMVNLYQFVPLGRPAMLLGHVTFSVSYVLVVVRSRLLAIGGDYEEAAQDLGASPLQAIRTILIPLLMPSIFASAMLVFATSLDDFVVSQFLFGDVERHRSHQAVQRRAVGPDPGSQRPGHAAAGGFVPGLILAYVGLRARRRGAGRRSRTSPTTADRHRRRIAVAASAAGGWSAEASTPGDCDGRWTVTGCPVARLS